MVTTESSPQIMSFNDDESIKISETWLVFSHKYSNPSHFFKIVPLRERTRLVNSHHCRARGFDPFKPSPDSINIGLSRGTSS